MIVSEVFGPTIQGEGPHAGQRVGFIRTANCNLACSWCDTPYSWDWKRYSKDEETRVTDPRALTNVVLAMQVQRVVITGGEPLMQQMEVIDFAREADLLIDIETNGTIKPNPDLVPLVDLFAVSPKLSNSGDRLAHRIKPEALEALMDTGKAIFKFVAATPADLKEIKTIVEQCGLPSRTVWVMPFGATRETHLNSLITLTDSVIQYGWNVSPRLHILAWDTKRAV